MNDTCNPANTYTYGWYAPCADPNTSNTNCIDVQTDHYVINGCDYIFTATNTATGCSYSKTVNVAIHPNPVLVFTINGNPATTDQANWFCENDPLHIAVHSQNPEVILDTTSINWTLGKIATGIAEFDTIGSSMLSNAVTFCVRANSEFGCPSGNASLPVSIIRTDSVFVKDTACTTYVTADPAVTITPAAYPFDTVIVRNYTKTVAVHGQYCDSVVTYNVHINDKPVITLKNNPAAFCESAGLKLNDFVDSFNVVWNGDTGTVKWIAAENGGDEIFTRINSLSDLTPGRYLITSQDGTQAMLNTPVTSTSDASYALGQATPVTTNAPATMIWEVEQNTDGSYSFKSDGKYIAGNSENKFSFNTTNTAAAAKWNVSFETSGGLVHFIIQNAGMTARYLKYNANASGQRFACYGYGISNTKWIAFYKSNKSGAAAPYAEVSGDTLLTYEFVSNNDIKRVATNCCGPDTADITFTVYKQPVINAFVAGNNHCAGEMYAFTANVSTFGTEATANLYLDGNTTTPLATTTVNGLNQAVTFTAVKLPHSYNGKTITISVVNNCNPDCGAVSIDSVLAVDTAIIDNFAALNNPHCVNSEMTIADFNFTTSGYDSYKLKLVAAGNTEPAPTTDADITLPYTFTDRSLDSALVYILASNHCYDTIISNVDTLFVIDKPSVTAITNIDQCDPGTFTLAEPSITWNGSDSITSGWLLLKNGAYAIATLSEIRDSALCPKVANAAYFAQGTCGSDTTKFTVTFALPPTVSFDLSSQCPNVVVTDAIINDVMLANCHSITSDAWYVKKADGTAQMTLPTGYTFANLLADGYNGGKLYHDATNDCGTTSANKVLDIPVYEYDTFKLQQGCNNTALVNFIQTGTYDWKGSVAPTLTIDTTYWQVNGATVDPNTFMVDASVTPINITYSYPAVMTPSRPILRILRILSTTSPWLRSLLTLKCAKATPSRLTLSCIA